MNQTLTPIQVKTNPRISLVLHLWLETNDELRASLEDTSSGERSYFSRLEDLTARLAETVQQLKATPLRKGIR